MTDPEPHDPQPVTSRPSTTRTLGHYLCAPSFDPPYIDIDQLSWDDIRQDACLRAIIALKRAGKPIGPDPVAAFDAEPRLVMTAYRRARAEALRNHLGRRPTKHQARWRLRHTMRYGFADIADPGQEEIFEAIVERISALSQIVVTMHSRWGGVSRARLRRLLILLRRIQRLRDSGVYVVPADLRKRVSRLRQETGLPLDIRRL